MGMPRFNRATFNAFVQSAKREIREAGAKARSGIVTPKFLSGKVDGATRTGQIIALLVLPFLIVVTLTIIRVINEVMTGVLGAGALEGEQLTITSFLVTALTLGCLIIGAWGWFQWVRTSGFGAFNL